MGFTINSLTGHQIQVSAPLPENINIHGTVFAGSIYTIATLTAWALVYSMLQDAVAAADLVLAEAHIRYKKPIDTDLNCTTGISAEDRTTFLHTLDERNRSRLQLLVNINEAAYWEGKLVAVRH